MRMQKELLTGGGNGCKIYYNSRNTIIINARRKGKRYISTWRRRYTSNCLTKNTIQFLAESAVWEYADRKSVAVSNITSIRSTMLIHFSFRIPFRDLL
jgi:hypothetical protein